jgi:hypothetical protein
MPASKVMHKFKHGELHSGSSKGPIVKNRKQAIAIMLSEKRNPEKYEDEVKGGKPTPLRKMFGPNNSKDQKRRTK